MPRVILEPECHLPHGLSLKGSFVIQGTHVGPSEGSLPYSLFLPCWNNPSSTGAKINKSLL